MGNVVPALFWLPPALLGVFLIIKHGQFLGPGLWCLIGSTILGWLAVNQFGFFENNRMRRHLQRILETQHQGLSGEYVFVGFATPKFSSMLDAHEDVGFLRILPDRLSFVSETRHIDVMRSDITEVRFRPNVHTLIGLGRWVSVEAKNGELPIRLLIEPRERGTMLGSKLYGSKLAKQLKSWLNPK